MKAGLGSGFSSGRGESRVKQGPSDGFVIRRAEATARDARAINAVYNPYVIASPATFDTVPVSEAARLARLTAQLADPRHPVMIATINDRPIGFASAAPFDERAAYGISIKTSVFVAARPSRVEAPLESPLESTGESPGEAPVEAPRGVGTALYSALFDALAGPVSLGLLHRAYALIVAPNDPSVRLHEAFGFRYLMTLSEVGRKFDRFHDVMWFEKRLV